MINKSHSEDDDIDSKLRFVNQPFCEAKKKAHHNTLERKRRNTLKHSFNRLKKIVPKIADGELTSRAQILQSAAEFIDTLERDNENYHKIIDEMTKRNARLADNIAVLERAKKNGKLDQEALDVIKNM